MSQKTLPKERKMKRVEDPEFYRFENIGDKVAGVLQEKGVYGNINAGAYVLKQDDGKIRKFHGSVNLDQKMKGVEIGKYCEVEYIDNMQMEKGKTPMKIFDVRVEE